MATTRVTKVLALEVLPSTGREFLFATVLHDFHATAADDLANARDRNAGNLAGHTPLSSSSEQQFVIVAAVQRQSQITNIVANRDAGGLDARSGAACLADMVEIGGKAVADVNHRCCQPVFSQVTPDLKARCWIEVGGRILEAYVLAVPQLFENCRR